MFMGEKTMTALRKMAQVASDLRKRGVIKKGDKVFCRGDNILSILSENYTIDFEIWWGTKKSGEEISETIKNSISQEEVYIQILNAQHIICTITPKKS